LFGLFQHRPHIVIVEMRSSQHFMNPLNSSDPLETIKLEALDRSGLSYERAFAIDDTNIALEIDYFAFLNLADNFYSKLTKDPNSKFQ
jgi:hypothetical protein